MFPVWENISVGRPQALNAILITAISTPNKALALDLVTSIELSNSTSLNSGFFSGSHTNCCSKPSHQYVSTILQPQPPSIPLPLALAVLRSRFEGIVRWQRAANRFWLTINLTTLQDMKADLLCITNGKSEHVHHLKHDEAGTNRLIKYFFDDSDYKQLKTLKFQVACSKWLSVMDTKCSMLTSMWVAVDISQHWINRVNAPRFISQRVQCCDRQQT